MFRFTIRDVLWLMVVVGMAVAWSIHTVTLQRRLSWERNKWQVVLDSLYSSGLYDISELPDGSYHIKERLRGGGSMMIHKDPVPPPKGTPAYIP